MKVFACVVLLTAAALAAPAPEGQRDKRSFLSSGWLGSGWDHDISPYSLSSPIFSHSLIAEPALIHKPAIIHKPTIIHEPAIVSVKKIVTVPKVVSLKKIVSVPEVISVPHVSSHISYAPSFSSGWW